MKDTNHKIFGYDWKDIQDRQMKRYVRLRIDVHSALPIATDSDKKMLEDYGSIEALKEAGFMGVVDRLSRS